jgi:hypothetical protein
MAEHTVARWLPGLGALLLLTGAATVAAVSGMASLFYEGWGRPVWELWQYPLPAAVLIAIGLVALRRPRLGVGLLLLAGLASGALWLLRQLSRGVSGHAELLVMLGILLAPIVATAALFLIDARLGGLPADASRMRRGGWLGRNWRAIVLVGVPLAGAVAMSAQQLPALLARHDDGLRGARVIASAEATLVWAPRGPGWNSRTRGGDYLSWIAIARHGNGPLDRCAYLSEDGSTLLDNPVHVWRLPSVREIVGALSRDGAGAGCRWDGWSPHTICRTPPDKETPLWAPDEAPIYYWSSQVASPGMAFAVNYTGGISVLPTGLEGLGIGFRCVKGGS